MGRFFKAWNRSKQAFALKPRTSDNTEALSRFCLTEAQEYSQGFVHHSSTFWKSNYLDQKKHNHEPEVFEFTRMTLNHV